MRSDKRGAEWFTALYAAEYPQVVRYGLRRLGDVESATELAQEVFLIAWRRRAEVPDRGLPWLYGVARRLLANEWRARRARPAIGPMSHPVGHGQPEQGLAALDIRAALARLPEPDQEILRLVGWEQLTCGEAAVVLGCSAATAAVRLYRARRRLAAALTDPVPTPSPRRPAAHL
jgi:RNA polymerase sigma-70 factor (ECF subfamily)